jgi:hypothetical protein
MANIVRNIGGKAKNLAHVTSEIAIARMVLGTDKILYLN